MGLNKTPLIYGGHATQLALTQIESGRHPEKGYVNIIHGLQYDVTRT